MKANRLAALLLCFILGCKTRQEPQPAVQAGDGFESGLTRIVALSWNHHGTTMLEVQIDGRMQRALAVGFGKKMVGDGGRVRVGNGSLDENSFQVFMERMHHEGTYDWYERVRIAPAVIIGVNPEVDSSGRIVKASSVGGLASGAAFLLSPEAFKALWGQRLMIVLKGDFVIDETGQKAIDAEFVRGELPTGTKPAGEKNEIQGGRFESWFTVEAKLNLNTATLDEIRLLPGIGPALAAKIVQARTVAGGFNTVADLLLVPGVGQDFLDSIKPFITVGKR